MKRRKLVALVAVIVFAFLGLLVVSAVLFVTRSPVIERFDFGQTMLAEPCGFRAKIVSKYFVTGGQICLDRR